MHGGIIDSGDIHAFDEERFANARESFWDFRKLIHKGMLESWFQYDDRSICSSSSPTTVSPASIDRRQYHIDRPALQTSDFPDQCRGSAGAC